MTPTDLDKETSVYDYETHTPYPTLAFILEQTGENLLNNNSADEMRAKAEIRQFTDMLKGQIKRRAYDIQCGFYIEYNIAFDARWRLDFIRAVARLIYYRYNINEDISQEISNIIRDSDYIRFARPLQPKGYKHRVGY